MPKVTKLTKDSNPGMSELKALALCRPAAALKSELAPSRGGTTASTGVAHNHLKAASFQARKRFVERDPAKKAYL